MTEVYWVCLGGGLAFALLAVFFGDLIEGLLDGLDFPDGLLDPLSLVGGVAAFGGAGLVLTEATGLGSVAVAALAAAIGLGLAVAMHFVYVRPMKRGENSTGFSVQEYRGKVGEVITAIPSGGFGEVLVRMGASNTFRTAASFDGVAIPSGARVVVVDVREGDLYVAAFEEEAAAPELAAAPRLLE